MKARLVVGSWYNIDYSHLELKVSVDDQTGTLFMSSGVDDRQIFLLGYPNNYNSAPNSSAER